MGGGACFRAQDARSAKDFDVRVADKVAASLERGASASPPSELDSSPSVGSVLGSLQDKPSAAPEALAPQAAVRPKLQPPRRPSGVGSPVCGRVGTRAALRGTTQPKCAA